MKSNVIEMQIQRHPMAARVQRVLPGGARATKSKNQVLK